MKDCKKEKNKIPMLKFDNNCLIPFSAIGTYEIKADELEEIFKNYPFEKIVIDTAFKYHNETEIAKIIYKYFERKNIVYISKISYEQQEKNNVKETLKQTLKNLKIDFIDIYLIHSPRHEKVVETWKQMIELKNMGFIRHIGVSNFQIQDIEKIYFETEVMPSINQIVMDIRDKEQKKLINFCQENDILVQMARPFGGKENGNKLNKKERNELIHSLYENKIMSIIGTSNAQHMLENMLLF